VILVLAGASAAALLTAWLSRLMVTRAARRRRYRRFLTEVDRHCRWPWVAVLLISANRIGLATIRQTPAVDVALEVLHVLLIAAVSWLVVKLLLVAEDALFQRLRIDVPDNRRRRRARTQVAILRRLTAVTVTLLALATMLTTFTPLRTLGASLFASAGVAGVLVGLAAQTTLTNVLAGLQLAWTDLLRFDDVVLVEQQWGRIEELTLTYVVVRLWDERRLVLPTTYFTRTPFENWSRRETRVLGSVMLHVDYRTPMAELRAEARRLVAASPLWDRRDWIVQVVDTTPSTMVVRLLVSSADAPSSWDLRCELREGLITFLTARYPGALPHARLVMSPNTFRPTDGRS
jgi:small-conductance mechanosensitive channel